MGYHPFNCIFGSLCLPEEITKFNTWEEVITKLPKKLWFVKGTTLDGTRKFVLSLIWNPAVAPSEEGGSFAMKKQGDTNVVGVSRQSEARGSKGKAIAPVLLIKAFGSDVFDDDT